MLSNLTKLEAFMANTLLCLAIALLAGLLFSRLAKLLNLPAVTAYLVAGIVIGPYALGQLSALIGVDGLGFTSISNRKGDKPKRNLA